MFNHFNTVCNISLRNQLIGCCVSATVLLSSAGTVLASPNHSSVVISASFGGGVACAPVCRPAGGFARTEYDQGVCAGRDKGFKAGYRDGMNGHCYDNCVTASFNRSSRFFEDGYRTAFAGAYVSGFERGNFDRGCREVRVEVRCAPVICEPVHVWRTPCVETRRVEVIRRAPVHRGRHR